MTTVEKERPTRPRRRSLKLTIVLGMVIFFVVATWHWLGRGERHDRQRRRDAIAQVRGIIQDEQHLKEQLEQLRESGGWLTGNLILMRNGDWLVYHSSCGRRSPGSIDNLFIGKGSDGKWYCSSWHFCSRIMNLESEGRPPGLAAMQMAYFLTPFDGSVENCPEETWPHKSEIIRRGGSGTATDMFAHVLRAEAAGTTWKRVRVLLQGQLYELDSGQLSQLEGYSPNSISGSLGGSGERWYSVFRKTADEKKELRIVIRRDSGLAIEHP